MNNEKGTGRIDAEHENPFVRWALGLIHPVEPFGDYFVRLRTSVEASAPVGCPSCA